MTPSLLDFCIAPESFGADPTLTERAAKAWADYLATWRALAAVPGQVATKSVEGIKVVAAVPGTVTANLSTAAEAAGKGAVSAASGMATGAVVGLVIAGTAGLGIGYLYLSGKRRR